MIFVLICTLERFLYACHDGYVRAQESHQQASNAGPRHRAVRAGSTSRSSACTQMSPSAAAPGRPAADEDPDPVVAAEGVVASQASTATQPAAPAWDDVDEEDDEDEGLDSNSVVTGPDGHAYRPGGWPHKLHRAAAPTLQTFRNSPHGQVVVTGNPMCRGQVLAGSSNPADPVQINGDPVAFETDMFVGRFVVHIAGLPTTQQHLFEGKKRMVHVALQGKFKKPIQAPDLVCGQEFVKPLPASIRTVVEVMLSVASRVFSNNSSVFVGKRPHFYNPLLATCQLLNVSRDGEEPELMSAQEDARLFEPSLVDTDGNPLTSDDRRKFFDNAANLAGRTIDTEHVWTIHTWQHLINFSDYRVQLNRFMGLDAASWAHGQPLQIMAKDKQAGAYTFNLLVWHERLLYGKEDSDSAKQRASLVSKIGGMRNGLMGMITGRG